MKSNHHIVLTAGLTAALILPARAIEAPADDAPPPPPAAEAPPIVDLAPAPEQAPEQAPGEDALEAVPEKQELAYLGVVSQEIPQLLAEHLGLKPDAGIVVQSVMPDGPASMAGIKENDIITHVADKPIASVFDLSREVQTHKPGDEIKVSVIQKGKPADINVKFGVRPDDLAMINPPQLDQLNLEGVPKELADRVRDAIRGNLDLKFEFKDPAVDLGDLEQLGDVNAEMQEEMKALRKRMEEAIQGIQGLEEGMPGVPQINLHQGATIRLLDEQGSVELKSNDGGKEVTLRDKDNNLTWTGPWDTEQDKAAAPDDVRKRVERLNIDTRFKGNGLRLQMGGAGWPRARE
jgi:membrane-associated protease RseP (regulator of RpoE activity)